MGRGHHQYRQSRIAADRRPWPRLDVHRMERWRRADPHHHRSGRGQELRLDGELRGAGAGHRHQLHHRFELHRRRQSLHDAVLDQQGRRIVVADRGSGQYPGRPGLALPVRFMVRWRHHALAHGHLQPEHDHADGQLSDRVPAHGGVESARRRRFAAVPPSPDGYYLSGTPVAITASANNGYKFAHWEGDLSGTLPSGYLTMSSPHTVQADFAAVPYIPPAGIQSVTGPTPSGAVAPGSLISIYGQNLAPSFQIGPTNPLSQTINN